MRWLPEWSLLCALTGLACGGSGGVSTPIDAGHDLPLDERPQAGPDLGLADDGGTLAPPEIDAAPRAACDPFAPEPDSTLPPLPTTVLAAGRDTAGTIYVVAASDSGAWVLISDGGTLVRQYLSNWTFSSDSEAFALGDHNPPCTLQIDRSLDSSGIGPVTRMGVVFALLDSAFVIGEQGEELTLLGPQDYANMPVDGVIPNQVVAAYTARLPDGRTMVITRPRHSSGLSSYQVFLGPAADLVERTVTLVLRDDNNGTTTFWFDLDGQTAVAELAELSPDGGTGSGTLELAGATLPLVRGVGVPADAKYRCLH